MKFHYTAADAKGKTVEGDIEAEETHQVITFLADQGLRPIAIKKTAGLETKKLVKFLTEAISIQDKIFLTKYLALMLRVGTDLYRAVDVLMNDFDKPAMRVLLIEVKDSLAKGQPLYSAFAKYPKYFNPVFINMVKAGEASGNLDKVFDDLSGVLEKQENLRRKIKSALVYPTILISLAGIIMFVLVSFALPRIAETFSSALIEPPLFSRVVFGVGLFFGKYLFVFLPLIFGSLIGGYLFIRYAPVGKVFLSRLLNRVPFVNEIIFKVAFQRFASTLSSLLRAGMPIIPSLETTAAAVGHPELEAAILRIAREGVAKGLTLGAAFQKEPFFPKVAVSLISVSEKAGNVESILDTLADFYEVEIDASIKTLLSLIEPILLVVIGGIVGIIALAIIVPIYQLIGSV